MVNSEGEVPASSVEYISNLCCFNLENLWIDDQSYASQNELEHLVETIRMCTATPQHGDIWTSLAKLPVVVMEGDKGDQTASPFESEFTCSCRVCHSVTFRVSAESQTRYIALLDRNPSSSCPLTIIMVSVSTRKYRLQSECSVRWTATQENSIGKEFPVVPQASESSGDYVLRTYLQFLWLPEVSINLSQVPSCSYSSARAHCK